MARADNSAFLTQAMPGATRRPSRRHATPSSNSSAREKPPTTPWSRSHPGVSRTWLYSQDQIRDLISQLRQQHTPAVALAAQHASTGSLRQRLDTARAEITRLRAENRSLRDQIARQLGLQRTQHASQPPARPR